jgi:hypothetical protein
MLMGALDRRRNGPYRIVNKINEANYEIHNKFIGDTRIVNKCKIVRCFWKPDKTFTDQIIQTDLTDEQTLTEIVDLQKIISPSSTIMSTIEEEPIENNRDLDERAKPTASRRSARIAKQLRNSKE